MMQNAEPFQKSNPFMNSVIFDAYKQVSSGLTSCLDKLIEGKLLLRLHNPTYSNQLANKMDDMMVTIKKMMCDLQSDMDKPYVEVSANNHKRQLQDKTMAANERCSCGADGNKTAFNKSRKLNDQDESSEEFAKRISAVEKQLHDQVERNKILENMVEILEQQLCSKI